MMSFRTIVILALVTLAIARPNPSSVKTIASSTGSKSSIKSPSQKLAEKNSPVASIVELPLQSVSQTESTNLNVGLPQSQDSDSGALQYSNVDNSLVAKPTNQDLVNQPSKVVPTIVKEDVKEEIVSVVQNEVVKPSDPLPVLDSHVVPAKVVETPVSVPVNSDVTKPLDQPIDVASNPVKSSVDVVPLSSSSSVSEEIKPLVAVVESKPVEAPIVVQPVASESIVREELHNSPSIPIEVVNKEIVNSPVVPSTIVDAPVVKQPSVPDSVVGVQPLAAVNPVVDPVVVSPVVSPAVSPIVNPVTVV